MYIIETHRWRGKTLPPRSLKLVTSPATLRYATTPREGGGPSSMVSSSLPLISLISGTRGAKNASRLSRHATTSFIFIFQLRRLRRLARRSSSSCAETAHAERKSWTPHS
jgi:hypothetical protein